MLKFYLCQLHNLTSLSNGKLFLRYFRQLFISLAFGKCKNDCNILKSILVKVFCLLKTEINSFDFLSGKISSQYAFTAGTYTSVRGCQSQSVFILPSLSHFRLCVVWGWFTYFNVLLSYKLQKNCLMG